MGLTPRMLGVLKIITEHVARYGAMPSRSQLAEAIDCHRTHAARTVARLIERGALHSRSPGGDLAGFGGAGVAVIIPADVAAKLARYCSDHDERLSAVVIDAITLHLDQLALADDEALALAVAVEALEGGQ